MGSMSMDDLHNSTDMKIHFNLLTSTSTVAMQ